MKERGILFQGDMVNAIRLGLKRMTRRVCPVQPTLVKGASPDEPDLWSVFYPWGEGGHGIYDSERELREEFDRLLLRRCPYGQAGDRLWVREAWRYPDEDEAGFRRPRTGRLLEEPLPHPVLFRADDHDPAESKWKPGIHLKREHARILLQVTAVRIERAQEISEADAKLEGAGIHNVAETARGCFVALWQRINGSESWEENPLVYVVSFDVVSIKGEKKC